MILPIHLHHGPLHHLLLPRQAIPPGDDAAATGTDNDATATPKTTRTTTITGSTSTGTGTSGSSSTSSSSSALDRVKATTHLEWWQLLCVALGGALVLFLGVWVIWKTKRRRAAEKKQAKEIQDQEDKKIQELLAQRQKELDEEDKEEEVSDEWDYSDGGTAVPRKRSQRRGGRKGSGSGRGGRGRGRDSSDSETESVTESDWSGSSSESGLSDRTYYERYRRPRRSRRSSRERSIRRSRDRDRDRRSDWDRGRSRERTDRRGDRYRDRDRSHRRQPSYSPSPSPTPLPPVPSLPKPAPQRKKREINFRDSVFSSYTSMKQAAVKLKHVEAKVKLKKALESEEKVEQARRDKIREANREIEMANRRTESGGSDRPVIPPVHRQTTSSSGGSTATTPHFPTPPLRSAARRGFSAESTHPTRPPARGATRTYSENTIPPVQSRAPHPARKPSGLNGEIQNLLGGKTAQAPPRSRPSLAPKQSAPKRPQASDNSFQNSWLARPDPGFSVPESASNSVYLPVTKPKDRPMIPPGGLAPAPPPKAKVKQSSGAMGTLKSGGARGVSGGDGGAATAGGAKWADRLRSRK